MRTGPPLPRDEEIRENRGGSPAMTACTARGWRAGAQLKDDWHHIEARLQDWRSKRPSCSSPQCRRKNEAILSVWSAALARAAELSTSSLS